MLGIKNLILKFILNSLSFSLITDQRANTFDLSRFTFDDLTHNSNKLKTQSLNK